MNTGFRHYTLACIEHLTNSVTLKMIATIIDLNLSTRRLLRLTIYCKMIYVKLIAKLLKSN